MYVVACPRFRARYEHTNCQNRARSRNSWPSGLHTIAFPFRVGRMEVCYLLSELMNYPYARGTRPSIENGLHWVLDVVFREDARRLYDRTAAENVAFLNRLALSLLRGDTGKGSLKVKRKRAGWQIPYLMQLLG